MGTDAEEGGSVRDWQPGGAPRQEQLSVTATRHIDTAGTGGRRIGDFHRV